MGLISSTTITADTPLPECHEYEMTLTFKMRSWDGPLDPRFAKALKSIFSDCDDGRYPFCVEMMENGLSDCMKWAAQAAVNAAMQEKHGREMVESDDGRSRTALWYLEAQKAKPVVPYICDTPLIGIERVPGDNQ
jgi:hypothetical protein